jgi:hypothetical protein
MKYLHVTEILELAGVANHDFVTDEAKWRGSEVHRATELMDRGRLKSTPDHIAGYLRAYERFKVECHFVPQSVEVTCTDKRFRYRGRADRLGMRNGKRCVCDIKSGAIQPAVKLQLCLYGHAIEPDRWWERIAVQLMPNGDYRAVKMDRLSYHADLAAAQAAVRLAHWKIQEGLR